MTTYKKEMTPVSYQASGVKILHFSKSRGDKSFPMHWHDRMELIRVKSGSLHVVLGDKHLDVLSDEVALFPPKMPHKGLILDEKVSYDVLMFDVRSFFNETEVCKRFLPAIFDGRAKFQMKTDNSQIISCFDEIVFEAGDRDFFVASKVYQLLFLLSEHALLDLSKNPPLDSFGIETLEYIHAYYDTDITTASLSARFGYSPEHFCRKFKEATWLSPMKYLRIFRLERACDLLRERKYSVSQIAQMTGFSDQNYFTRCFKAHFGVPPREY